VEGEWGTLKEGAGGWNKEGGGDVAGDAVLKNFSETNYYISFTKHDV